jgi:hypothetical protein
MLINILIILGLFLLWCVMFFGVIMYAGWLIEKFDDKINLLVALYFTTMFPLIFITFGLPIMLGFYLITGHF